VGLQKACGWYNVETVIGPNVRPMISGSGNYAVISANTTHLHVIPMLHTASCIKNQAVWLIFKSSGLYLLVLPLVLQY
jgi:hypothetical protein